MATARYAVPRATPELRLDIVLDILSVSTTEPLSRDDAVLWAELADELGKPPSAAEKVWGSIILHCVVEATRSVVVGLDDVGNTSALAYQCSGIWVCLPMY